MPCPKKPKAFTLIELLVVVAIIALLISILLPSLSRARDTARMVACQSIQRQFGVANHMYADDSDNYFVSILIPTGYPTGSGWWYQNVKYRDMIGISTDSRNRMPIGLLCPNMPDEERDNGVIYRSYAMNRDPLLWGGPLSIHRVTVEQPSQKAQMSDNNDPNMTRYGADYRDRWDAFGELHTSEGGSYAVAYRHSEGVNIQHYDGHAAYYTKQEAFPLNASGQPDWNRINQLWVALTFPTLGGRSGCSLRRLAARSRVG